MKLATVLLVIACLATANGFRFLPPTAQRFGAARFQSGLKMSDEEAPPKPAAPKPSAPKTVELVPLDKESMGNAVTATGGILGFVLGGPVLAALLAAVTNYVAKQEGDSGDALRGVGKSVVESYNYLTNINGKYGLVDKLKDSVSKTVSSLEKDSEIVERVRTTVDTTTTKLDELNKEYDLVAKGKQVLVAAGTLSDTALEKLVELNAKYDFVETTKKAATSAIDKAKDKAKEAADSARSE